MKRIYYFDAVRVIAMLVGIVTHSVVAFTPHGFYPWPVRNAITSNWFSTWCLFSLIFRMAVFYFLAGFFGAYLLKKYNAYYFIKQRIVSLGIPLLLGMLFMTPFHLTGLWLYVNQQHLQSVTWPLINYFFNYTGALWFISYLLWIYAIIIVLQLVFAKLLHKFVLIGLLFVPFIILLVSGQTMVLPEFSVIPKIPNLIYYLSFTLFGWIMWQQQAWLTGLKSIGWILLLVAMFILFPTYLYLTQQHLFNLVAKLLYVVIAWSMTLGLIGFCMRFFARASKFWQYMSHACYWFYLAQVPIIFVLQAYFISTNWPMLVKVVAIIGSATIILLLSYEIIVKRTFVARILKGHLRASK